jgi:G3E family GTPase
MKITFGESNYWIDGGGITLVKAQDTPIEWPSFWRAMAMPFVLRGADLLRAKGILDVVGCRGPVVVQYVQHLAHPPVELQAWPDANRMSRLVFITRNISERQVRDLFAAVQALVKI